VPRKRVPARTGPPSSWSSVTTYGALQRRSCTSSATNGHSCSRVRSIVLLCCICSATCASSVGEITLPRGSGHRLDEPAVPTRGPARPRTHHGAGRASGGGHRRSWWA
jgi:hypothetical protein